MIRRFITLSGAALLLASCQTTGSDQTASESSETAGSSNVAAAEAASNAAEEHSEQTTSEIETVTGERVTSPTSRVGDWWLYETDAKTFRLEVIAVDADTVTVRMERNGHKGTFVYTSELNALRYPYGDRLQHQGRVTPAGCTYDFPLAVGKSWDCEYDENVINSNRFRSKVSAQVTERSTVTVPTGSFEVLVIQYDVTTDVHWDRGWEQTRHRDQTVWYAPAVERAVKRERTDRWRGDGPDKTTRSSYVLVDYELGDEEHVTRR